MASLLNKCVDLDTLSNAFAMACCRDAIQFPSSGNEWSLQAQDTWSYYFDPALGVCHLDSMMHNASTSSSNSYQLTMWNRCPTYDQRLASAIPYLPPQRYLKDSTCTSSIYDAFIFNFSSSSSSSSSFSSSSSSSPFASHASFAKVPFNRPIQEGIDTFNCNAIPQCKISCNGPDKEIIRAVVKECSCNGEWAFHSTILQILVGLWVFICINASRVWIVEGVVRLSWKKLSPKVFEFRGDCSLVEEGVEGKCGEEEKGSFSDFKENKKALATFQPSAHSLQTLPNKLENSLKWFTWYDYLIMIQF